MNAPDLPAAEYRHVTARTDPAAERPLLFACEGERLFGILHPATGTVGVVIVVGGPQYRAGSHRHFVELARALAAAGHPVLRFDVRGMGDSSGPLHTFEHITADIAAAITALQGAQPQVQRVTLWGLCDGASAALLYLHERPDPRVAGLALLNPWVRSAQSLARTHVKHYYRQRLMQGEFWRKLLRGAVALAAARDFVRNLRLSTQAPPERRLGFQARMAEAWRAFAGPILLVLSGDDHTAREFIEYTRADPRWDGLIKRARVRRLEVAGADHTFSKESDRRALEAGLECWLEEEYRT